jgi:hypothetical protein
LDWQEGVHSPARAQRQKVLACHWGLVAEELQFHVPKVGVKCDGLSYMYDDEGKATHVHVSNGWKIVGIRSTAGSCLLTV